MALKDVGVRLVVEGTGKFKNQMAGVERQIGGVGQAIARNRRQIGLGLTALGASIVAVGALSVKTFAEMGDEVQKMAIKTGFSTEKLSELRFAAQLSGASLKSIEKGVKTMSSALVDANEGLETYARSFRQLGIDVEATLALAPEEQFRIITEALADVENQTIKSALAQDIFGRAGLDLLPLLEQGSEGMREMAAEARELGIIFDQEAANAAALFNDNITRLGSSFDGVKFAIANTLIPILTPLIEKITTVVKGIIDWTKANPELTRVLTLVIGGIGGLALVLGPILLILPQLVAGIGLVSTALLFLAANPIVLIVAAIAGIIAAVLFLMKNWEQLKASAIKIWNSIVAFFKKVWTNITAIFKKHWDKILAILFPAIGIPILMARNWEKLQDAMKKIWENIVSFVRNGVNTVIDFLNVLIDGLNVFLRFLGIQIPRIPRIGAIAAAAAAAAVPPAAPFEDIIRDPREFPQGVFPITGPANAAAVPLPAIAPATELQVTNITNFNVEASYTNPQDPATIALDLEALTLEATK